MFGEYSVHIYLVLAIAGTLALATVVPPLTSASDWFSETPAHVQSARKEYAFCAQNLGHVDCACFASKAGHVLSSDAPRIPGSDGAVTCKPSQLVP